MIYKSISYFLFRMNPYLDSQRALIMWFTSGASDSLLLQMLDETPFKRTIRLVRQQVVPCLFNVGEMLLFVSGRLLGESDEIDRTFDTVIEWFEFLGAQYDDRWREELLQESANWEYRFDTAAVFGGAARPVLAVPVTLAQFHAELATQPVRVGRYSL